MYIFLIMIVASLCLVNFRDRWMEFF